MKTFNADAYIQKLNLIEHPEGGFYRETYRSEELIDASTHSEKFSGMRVFSTAIYFLLKAGQFSALHRLDADEIWHFYDGDSLIVHSLNPQGVYEQCVLGKNLEKGENFQTVIKAGNWFGCSVPKRSEGGLVGCTVSPGFDFENFELANREKLIQEYPDFQELITQLTHE